jgi:plastocyanin
MRKLWILLTATGLAFGTTGLGGWGIDAAAAKSSNPVSVSGKVNVKGKKDISGKKSATIEIEQDDYYFEPTFLKVSPGEKVTVKLKNEGSTTHTFTSDSLAFDKQVASDKSSKVTFTVPSSGTAFEFHCSIHQALGMQGAVYTKAGGKAS